MSTFLKSLNKQNTKFSINGKLAVLTIGGSYIAPRVLIKYSSELTDKEMKDFKSHLGILKII